MVPATPREHAWVMSTRIDEIAPRIHRISTLAEGPPGGITMNQFLLAADEPLLFHTGPRRLFSAVRDAVARVLDPTTIRFVSSGHASRPDEYGALDEWLSLAPRATVAHGRTGCFLCLRDAASREPRALDDGETIDLGALRVRWIDTPHVPGPWEAGVLFEETTGSLFCGDLFSRAGACDATTADEIVEAAIGHDRKMHGHAITPWTAPTLRRLAALKPRRLALMHGPTFVGDGQRQLLALADYFEAALQSSSSRLHGARTSVPNALGT
jgi:flavorubredoxin